jgi:hypothetical protein
LPNQGLGDTLFGLCDSPATSRGCQTPSTRSRMAARGPTGTTAGVDRG